MSINEIPPPEKSGRGICYTLIKICISPYLAFVLYKDNNLFLDLCINIEKISSLFALGERATTPGVIAIAVRLVAISEHNERRGGKFLQSLRLLAMTIYYKKVNS